MFIWRSYREREGEGARGGGGEKEKEGENGKKVNKYEKVKKEEIKIKKKDK